MCEWINEIPTVFHVLSSETTAKKNGLEIPTVALWWWWVRGWWRGVRGKCLYVCVCPDVCAYMKMVMHCLCSCNVSACVCPLFHVVYIYRCLYMFLCLWYVLVFTYVHVCLYLSACCFLFVHMSVFAHAHVHVLFHARVLSKCQWKCECLVICMCSADVHVKFVCFCCFPWLCSCKAPPEVSPHSVCTFRTTLCVCRQNVRGGCFDGTRGGVHTGAFSRHTPLFLSTNARTTPTIHKHTPHTTHNTPRSQHTKADEGTHNTETLRTQTRPPPAHNTHDIKYNESECLHTPTSFCTPVIHRSIGFLFFFMYLDTRGCLLNLLDFWSQSLPKHG